MLSFSDGSTSTLSDGRKLPQSQARSKGVPCPSPSSSAWASPRGCDRRRGRGAGEIAANFSVQQIACKTLRSRPGTKCAFGRSQRWEGKEVDAGDAQHRRSRPTLLSRLWRCSNGQVVSWQLFSSGMVAIFSRGISAVINAEGHSTGLIMAP